MKVSENFDIREFVPSIIWNRYGVNSIWFIEPRIIQLAQFTRDYFGIPISVNNWHLGGKFQNRGYRTPNTKIGALYSQHKRGCAFDFSSPSMSAEEMYNAIMLDQFAFMEQGLTTLEEIRRKDGSIRTWVHADIRSTNITGRVLIVQG